MIIYKFYDTCSLLLKGSNIFDAFDEIPVISSITLQELEDIKTSRYKDEEIKFAARQILRSLSEHKGEYEVHIFRDSMLEPICEKTDFLITNDLRILATAFDYDRYEHPDATIFVTNDLALAQIANLFFGEDSIESVNEEQVDQYTGYKEIVLNDEQLNLLYSDLNTNHFQLLINQYLIVKNINNEIIDRLCWTGSAHRRLIFKDFSSNQFGTIKPLSGDTEQLFAADSLNNNTITMLCGKPGSGKTTLAFGYLFHALERHAIERIIIFCNPVVAKDAARLGFYPGSRIEKIMESQVGAVLTSKLGDATEVERLITNGKLVLLPAGDARGYEVPPYSGVYVMEAQNLTNDLLRMLLQRVTDDCKVIIDGDFNEQVDMQVYAGSNNGMRKMSKVFRGSELYGQVELKNIHRSAIAALADQMK